MPQHKRGPWSQQEDDLLLALVDQYGASNWVRISSTIQTRSPKQCRERFHQNLKPNLNHDPISPEEGVLIEQMVAEMGKRWAEIARRLRGRSDNAVKNWWNGGMNRRRRHAQQRQAEVQVRHRYHPHAHHPHLPMHNLPPPMQQPLPVFGGALTPHYFVTQQQYIGHPQQYGHFPLATFGRMPMVEAPLPSPSAFSQVSADGAPSLVSDRSSIDNRSPRHGPSPHPVDLPPLAGSREERRTSAPLLRLGVPGEFAQDTDFALQGFQSFGDMRKPVLQEGFMPQSTSLPVPTSYLPSQPRQPSPYPTAQQMQQGYLMTNQVQRRQVAYPMHAQIPTTPMSQHHHLPHEKYQYGGHIDSGVGTPTDESPKAKMSLSNLTH